MMPDCVLLEGGQVGLGLKRRQAKQFGAKMFDEVPADGLTLGAVKDKGRPAVDVGKWERGAHEY